MSREDEIIGWVAMALDEIAGEDLIEHLDQASTGISKNLAMSDCRDYNDLCPTCDGSLYLLLLLTAAAEALEMLADRVEIRSSETRTVN